jgi:hypothetical protein
VIARQLRLNLALRFMEFREFIALLEIGGIILHQNNLLLYP